MTPSSVYSSYRLAGALALCLCIGSAVAVTEINFPLLPHDPDDAHRLLAEGTLASAVWRKIEPFYTAPINVPQGDLQILADLFIEASVESPF